MSAEPSFCMNLYKMTRCLQYFSSIFFRFSDATLSYLHEKTVYAVQDEDSVSVLTEALAPPRACLYSTFH